VGSTEALQCQVAGITEYPLVVDTNRYAPRRVGDAQCAHVVAEPIWAKGSARTFEGMIDRSQRQPFGRLLTRNSIEFRTEKRDTT
jgi:hypothetical protein